MTAETPAPAPATTPAPAAAPTRSRLGTIALVFAIISASFPVLTFLVGWATADPAQGQVGAAVLAAVLVLIAEVALMPIAGIVGLVLAILAIRRGGADRPRGVIALVVLGVGVVLVIAQLVVYAGVTMVIPTLG